MKETGNRSNMKRVEEELWTDRRMDEERQLWIDTLSHARHDWLNDLQLIIGYVQLRKYDKLAGCVEMLKRRLTEEGRVSKLGALGLVELFLTYRTRPRPFRFELRVGDVVDLRNAADSPDDLETVIRCVLDGFERAAAQGVRGADNSLCCSFDTDKDDVTVQFTYEGAYAAEALSKAVGDIQKRQRSSHTKFVLEEAYGDSQVQLALRVPIRRQQGTEDNHVC
jgi:stage 0 sporulation protein B (sporulation initiation phosphotransferase)